MTRSRRRSWLNLWYAIRLNWTAALRRFGNQCWAGSAVFLGASAGQLFDPACGLPWESIPSGVVSAGNGAAMRAAILGAFFHDQPEARQAFGRAIAEVTHRDERAIEGAIYVAEMAAACVRSPIDSPRHVIQSEARKVVRHPQLGSALDQAQDLAGKELSTLEAAKTCGTSGFVVHTVPFATFIFLQYGDDPLFALTEAVNAGGDTDSIGAIVGGWLGALHGAGQMPDELLNRIHDGPFGPTHLRALGAALCQVRQGEPCIVPGYSVSERCFGTWLCTRSSSGTGSEGWCRSDWH